MNIEHFAAQRRQGRRAPSSSRCAGIASRPSSRRPARSRCRATRAAEAPSAPLCKRDLDTERKIQLLAQRLHRAERLDAAGVHQGEAVDPLLDLGEDVRAQDGRRDLSRATLQDLVEIADALRVKAVGGLVEEQDTRRPEQRLRERQPLSHSFRILTHADAARRRQGRPARAAPAQEAASAAFSRAKKRMVSRPDRLS